MSDITRDDLFTFLLRVSDDLDRLEELEPRVGRVGDANRLLAFNDELRANRTEVLRALLTDQCETCGGTGDPNPPCDDPECALDHAGSCPDCGGRGWLPKNGVTELTLADLTRTKGLFIPLDWLEADNEQ